MKEIDTLFLFCEGPHDVAFCYLVMKYCFGLETVKDKFSKYPAPLHILLPQNMQNHVAGDLSLDMAHKFFLPDRTMTNGDQHVLLFNMGGKTKVENPKQFLSAFLTLNAQKKTFSKNAKSILGDVRYLFLYDADHDPVPKILNDCHNAFNIIDEKKFIANPFVPWPVSPCAGTSGDTAVYILGDSTTGKGTLEDILLPIYQANQPEWCEKSEQFINDCFDWKLGLGNAQQQIAAKAKKTKALITTAGQGKKPGRPMTAIIQDDVLGSEANFLGNHSIKQFAKFIHDFAKIPEVNVM